MGLVVRAFSGIRLVESSLIDDDDEPTSDIECVRARFNPHFPERASDLTENGVYAFENSDGIIIGSCGYYGDWRRQLETLSGVTRRVTPPGGPFWELINFSDNQGCIGPSACARLYQDFKNHEEAAEVLSTALDADCTTIGYGRRWFLRTYQQLASMFLVASDRGLVEFY